MTKEQIKSAIEVMQAGLDGKTIQCKSRIPHDLDDWGDVTILDKVGFDWIDYDYRIKPEPKVRPYKDCDECWVDMQKHKPFGWVVDEDGDYISIHIVSNRTIDFDETFYYWKYIDGSPFGIVEE